MLLYESRFKYFKGKLMTRWLGPYTVEKCFDNGVVQIRTIDEEGIPLLVNGHRLKIYKNPLSKVEFLNLISRGVCDGQLPSFPHLLKKNKKLVG